jgi:tRNA(adenine34) deaminase
MTKSSCSCCAKINRRSFVGSSIGLGIVTSIRTTSVCAEAILAAANGTDESFMRQALEEARRGDFPFGAVIVRDGKVMSSGHNVGVKTNDPTAHGEIIAIRNFVSKYPSSDLKQATIYTTGEPCPMCMGAIIWSGFKRVVYAASIKELSSRIGQIMITSHTIADAAPESKIEIIGGILASEALELFK